MATDPLEIIVWPLYGGDLPRHMMPAYGNVGSPCFAKGQSRIVGPEGNRNAWNNDIAVDPDGAIYAIVANVIYKIDSDKKPLWQMLIAGGELVGLCVDADDLYVTLRHGGHPNPATDWQCYKIDKWSFEFQWMWPDLLYWPDTPHGYDLSGGGVCEDGDFVYLADDSVRHNAPAPNYRTIHVIRKSNGARARIQGLGFWIAGNFHGTSGQTRCCEVNGGHLYVGRHSGVSWPHRVELYATTSPYAYAGCIGPYSCHWSYSFSGVNDVAFDSDGNLYVRDNSAGAAGDTIKKLSAYPVFAYQSQWNGGSYPFHCIGAVNGGLAITSDDRVVVLSDVVPSYPRDKHRVYEFELDGDFVDEWGRTVEWPLYAYYDVLGPC